MHLFYEAWQPVLSNRHLLTDDLRQTEKFDNHQLPNDEPQIIVNAVTVLDLGFLLRHTIGFDAKGFSADTFFSVGIIHHSEILAKENCLMADCFISTVALLNFGQWTR